jgi:hypothetical protein|tara:strand:- start:47 stop:859 length:813 start_codon:yes stop_codon:yes gene_type:complete
MDTEVYDRVTQLSLYCGNFLEGYQVTGYRWASTTAMTFYTSRDGTVINILENYAGNSQITAVTPGIVNGKMAEIVTACTVDPGNFYENNKGRLLKGDGGKGKPGKRGFARVQVGVEIKNTKAPIVKTTTGSVRTTTTTAGPAATPDPYSGAPCKDIPGGPFTAVNDPTGALCCAARHSCSEDEHLFCLGPGCCMTPHDPDSTTPSVAGPGAWQTSANADAQACKEYPTNLSPQRCHQMGCSLAQVQDGTCVMCDWFGSELSYESTNPNRL